MPTFYRYMIEWTNHNGRGNCFVVAVDAKDARSRFRLVHPTADIERVLSMGELAEGMHDSLTAAQGE